MGEANAAATASCAGARMHFTIVRGRVHTIEAKRCTRLADAILGSAGFTETTVLFTRRWIWVTT
jgi:hypothetical protein